MLPIAFNLTSKETLAQRQKLLESMRQNLLINRYQGIVYRLNDLKAICSLDKLTSTQEDDVGRMVSSIEQSIAKVKEMRNSIIEKMQNIVCEYTKRIKK